MLTEIKVVRSHVGIGRYMDGLKETQLVIPRQADIPSPYAYSAAWPVYEVGNGTGDYVVIRETSHKVYRVYAVPASMTYVEEA